MGRLVRAARLRGGRRRRSRPLRVGRDVHRVGARRPRRVRHADLGRRRAVVERPDRDVGTELRGSRPVAARAPRAPEPRVHRPPGDPRRLLLGRLLDGRGLPARADARRRRAVVERDLADHGAERARHRPQRPDLRPSAARGARRGHDRAQGRLLAAVVGAPGERRLLAGLPTPAREGAGADLPAGRLVRSLLRVAPALVRRDRRPRPEPRPDRPLVARGGGGDVPRRRRPLAGADRDPRPRARLLRPLPEGRRERLGRAPARRAVRPRRERVARRAGVAARASDPDGLPPSKRRRPVGRRAEGGRAGRPLRLRPRGSRPDGRRRQLGADDDAGRRDADPPGAGRPARPRGARRRPRLHERAARPAISR